MECGNTLGSCHTVSFKGYHYLSDCELLFEIRTDLFRLFKRYTFYLREAFRLVFKNLERLFSELFDHLDGSFGTDALHSAGAEIAEDIAR